jgi:CubicO group peptidase (beta-lactamase class C family)
VSTHQVTSTRRVLRCAALFLALLTGEACAAPLSLPDAFRRNLETGSANGAYHQVAVALIQGKQEQIWSFAGGKGSAQAEVPGAFEIGAVTEGFTGLLLAQAVLDGKLRLGDPLRSLLPSAFPWRDAALADRPVESLATHRSGLPATPPNLFPASMDDPYADYHETDLLALLANLQGHNDAPAVVYSPLNGALLALILARAYGTDFPALLTNKVLVPLGMTHSEFGDPAGLLAGHAYGGAAAHWHHAATAGAAGLRSTLGDLLAFVRSGLKPEASPLRGALLLVRQSRAEGPVGGVGLGWNVHDVAAEGQTWPLVWRASESGGFSTFVGFRTDRQQGLVLLADSAADLATLGIAWLTDQPAPAAPPTPFAPTAEQVERYPGLYHLLSGGEIVIRRNGRDLTTQLRGQPPWPLYPLAEDVYTSAGGAIGITFVRNIDVISGLVLGMNGEHVTAQRLSARAPRLARTPIALEPAALTTYAGDYRIDAGALVRITAAADGLDVQYTGTAAMRMRPYGADRFSDADGLNGLIFHRDEHGRIDSVAIDFAGAERRAEPARWRAP